MTTLTFRTRRIIGPRPDHIPVGVVAFCASRPLYGAAVELHGPIDWAGQTTLDPADSNFERFLVENQRLDAAVVVWITREELIALERARLTAEYGAERVAEVDDDDVFSMAQAPEPTVFELAEVAR